MQRSQRDARRGSPAPRHSRVAQKRQLLDRLRALGHSLEIETVGHSDSGRDHRCRFTFGRCIHERLVDLDFVDRQGVKSTK